MNRIIAEMKRRLDGFREEMEKGDSITGCMTLAGRCAALEEMIEYIETLQKESVSDDLVKMAEDYANKHSVLLGFDCDSEPIQTGTDIKNAVIYGARWQKRKMMDSAVIGEVTIPASACFLQVRYKLPKDTTLKYRDKVKLLIMEKV